MTCQTAKEKELVSHPISLHRRRFLYFLSRTFPFLSCFGGSRNLSISIGVKDRWVEIRLAAKRGVKAYVKGTASLVVPLYDSVLKWYAGKHTGEVGLSNVLVEYEMKRRVDEKFKTGSKGFLPSKEQKYE